MINNKLHLCLAILVVLIASSTVYISCRKGLSTPQTSGDIIKDAETYFNSQVLPTHNPDADTSKTNFRKSIHKTPDWSKAIVEQLTYGPTVTVPLSIKEPMYLKRKGQNLSINDLSFLLIYKDSTQQYRAEVITKVPTDTFLRSQPTKRIFSGIITVESWSGQFIKAYRYTPQGVPTKALSTSPIMSNQNGSKVVDATIQPFVIPQQPLADCYETDWWGCIEDDCVIVDGAEICFPEDDDPTPDPSFYQYAGSGVIGTTSSLTFSQLEKDFLLLSPAIPITNFQQYIECFDNNGSNYTVTIYVDQPAPGTSAAFCVGTDNQVINVGHTFLAFDEIGSDNGEITRVMGFYPAGTANPLTPTSTGTLGNDAGHSANVAISFVVSNTQFNSILNFMGQAYSLNYNLNTNNCTSYALSALAAGGIAISTTISFWPGGWGENPGALGQTFLNSSSPYGSNAPTNTVTRTTNITNGPNNFGCGL